MKLTPLRSPAILWVEGPLCLCCAAVCCGVLCCAVCAVLCCVVLCCVFDEDLKMIYGSASEGHSIQYGAYGSGLTRLRFGLS